jgi:hypothetical protein
MVGSGKSNHEYRATNAEEAKREGMKEIVWPFICGLCLYIPWALTSWYVFDTEISLNSLLLGVWMAGVMDIAREVLK